MTLATIKRRGSRWCLAAIALVAAVSIAVQSRGPVQRAVVYGGEDAPAVVRYSNPEQPNRYCFAIPHENEATAFQVATEFITKHGGTIVRAEQKRMRDVEFSDAGGTVKVDPNRVMTPEGVRRTLIRLNPGISEGSVPAAVADRVALFGHRFVEAIDACRKTAEHDMIVAVHNNRDASQPSDYSVTSYARGGSAAGDVDTSVAGNPAIHASLDSDDFFVVTDRRDFDRLRGDWNVALLSRAAADDGSLAVYYLAARYINVEAQHGAGDRQAAMLQAALLAGTAGHNPAPPR